jgi:protein-S-isoprenylcysteine O-methyltransferase Ste14
LFWSLIAYRTPMEEKKLIETFGDEYRQYMQRAWRFLPMPTLSVSDGRSGSEG